jgi:hypothetical protein
MVLLFVASGKLELYALTWLSISNHVLWFIELSIISSGQDKWRNINVTAIWGSRQKAKLALKRDLPTPKLADNPMALSTVPQSDAEIVDAKPLAISRATLQTADSKEPFARLHSLVI